MGEPLAFLMPKENVNDETAKLVAWFVEDGARVESGALLAQVETSKAVLDIEAPVAGVVRFAAKAGDEVEIGGVPCRIGDGPASVEAPLPKAEDPSAAPAPPMLAPIIEAAPRAMAVAVATNGHAHEPAPATSPRFSRAARELLAARGIDPGSMAATGLVRSADLLRLLSDTLPPCGGGRGGMSSAPAVATPHPNPPPQGGRGSDGGTTPSVIPATGVGFKTEALSRAKQTEAKYIRSAYDSTLASVVTVACPTSGFRSKAGDVAPALILFETARLLRKYSTLNAFHRDGEINTYDDVNLGHAIDAGRGLKVPVIRLADKKSVAAIADELREAIVAYLGDGLPFESLAGGTFTVTDLAGEGVASFVPLINQGQSAILGVGGEVSGHYSLVLTFDHQLSEGRLAARFLNELKASLAHHEGVMAPSSPTAAMPCCGRCARTAEELDELGIFLVPTARADGSSASGGISAGIDIESVGGLPEADDYWEHPFFRSTFTPAEISYCVAQPSPRSHFAARWSAKEALRKCDRAFLDVPLDAVEVVRDAAGAPTLRRLVGGEWRPLPHALSLSHTHDAAVAVVIALAGTPLPSPISGDTAPAPIADAPAPPMLARRGPARLLEAAFLLAALTMAALALYRTYPHG